MSKTKSANNTQVQNFSDSELKIGDTTLAKTYKDSNGNIINQYIPTQSEAQTYQDYANQLAEYISKVDTFSPEYYAQKDETLSAMKTQGVEEINATYKPMIEDLKNDVAKRFGTLNTTSFLDDLDEIEDKRASAVADLETNLISTSNEMDSEQLTNNYKYIALLQSAQSSYLSNILDILDQSSSTSSGTTTKTTSDDNNGMFTSFYSSIFG